MTGTPFWAHALKQRVVTNIVVDYVMGITSCSVHMHVCAGDNVTSAAVCDESTTVQAQTLDAAPANFLTVDRDWLIVTMQVRWCSSRSLNTNRKSQGKSPKHNHALHTRHPHSLEWHNSTIAKSFPAHFAMLL